MLQGGDPKGNGTGGPGYTVVGPVPAGYHYKLGDVAMAKTEVEPSGTAGSQFFVISGAQGEGLPTDYGLLGHAADKALARDDQAHRELRDPVERPLEADLHLDGEGRQGVASPIVRALVLQHIACEPPGAFAEVMRERGWETVTCEIDETGSAPDAGEFDAIVAMGGPMSVNDEQELPWLVDEKRLIGDAVRAGVPYFGACLGVQLLAASLGGPGLRRRAARRSGSCRSS